MRFIFFFSFAVRINGSRLANRLRYRLPLGTLSHGSRYPIIFDSWTRPHLVRFFGSKEMNIKEEEMNY